MQLPVFAVLGTSSTDGYPSAPAPVTLRVISKIIALGQALRLLRHRRAKPSMPEREAIADSQPVAVLARAGDPPEPHAVPTWLAAG